MNKFSFRLVWLLIAVYLSIAPWAWHVSTFRANSEPTVFAALCALPILLAGAVWAVHRFRVPRWEPLLLLGLPLLLCLVRTPVATLLGIALFLSAHTIGSYLLADAPASRPLRISLRFGAGISVMIVALFFVGLAGGLRWPLAVLLLLPALGSRAFFADLRGLRESWVAMEDLRHPVISTLLTFGLVFGIAGAVWAITPAISFDPLKMHLENARWYAELGAFRPSPSSPQSYFPQGAELLMAMLWTLGGQGAAQLLSPLFFLASLLISVFVLRACGLSPAATVCGIIAAGSIPFLHWTGFVAKNDAPLAFFLFAALACLLEKRLVLASAFLAMAFGIKHVALFGAVGLTPLFLREIWRSDRRVRQFLAVTGVFLALGLLSMIRTYALTGNPFYPESTKRTTDISVVTHPYQSNAERVMRYAGIPWLLHFDGLRAFESASPNPMGLWLVFFPFAWLSYFRNSNHALRLALLFCAVYLLYWVSILVTLRYAIVPLFLLTAITAPALFRLPRLLAAGFAFYCLSFSLTVCILNEVSATQLFWLTRRIDNDMLLRRMLHYYPATKALYGKAQAEDSVFSLNGCAAPYAPFPGTVYCFDEADFSHSPEAVAAELGRKPHRFAILPSSPVRDLILAKYPGHIVLFEDTRSGLYEIRGR